MSTEESLEVRQKNEFEALQAIYGDDIKDLRGKTVWNKWRPLNLSLSLTPQQGSSGTQEVYVKVDLHIICSEKYPDSVPKILLENSKGLSNIVLAELQQKLEQKALELQGEEVIFQLSQLVEEFLHCHNKPASKSFYDEMLERQKEKEQKDLQARKSEQDRQRQHMREEIESRQEILKAEVRLRRENRQNSENDEEFDINRRFSLTARRRTDSSTDSSDESLCQHKSTAVIEFNKREIRRGQCIKHSTPNHVVFSGLDNESGELVIISEWHVNINTKNDLVYIQRQLSSIEQEMNYLIKLKHLNLAHFYSFKYHVKEKEVVVYLLKEFVNGSNCFSLFSNQHIKVDTEFIKHIAKGVLTSLEYLHRNNVVHKDIKDTNVYINDTGLVKLANCSIHKRLSDLILHVHNTYTKKTDIFNFGKLLLCLLQGNGIVDDNLAIPNSIQSDLYDFLMRCVVKDESQRYTAAQLLNHSFFRKPAVIFSPKHVTEEVQVDRTVSPETVQELLSLSQSSNGQSRLNSEFEFLQNLGSGAFGDVLKVRNKLDGCYYAIKRIRLNPKNRTLNKKIVREVKLLSRLNHENVVRYYNSWIETTTITEDLDNSSSVSSADKILPNIIRRDEFSINDNIEALAPPLKNVEVSITYDGRSQIAFNSPLADDSSSDDEDEAWGAVYDEESESDGIEFAHDSDTLSKDSLPSAVSSKDSTDLSKMTETTNRIDSMYIQMEFCEKSTLRTAIDNNLYLDEDRLWRLFREIVEGLGHIHQQGMIHRDLKPVNIFLDSEDHVKIGDFGLATTVLKSRQNEYVVSKSLVESEKEDITEESKTGQVGTALYVAPEINGPSKVVYNQKVDIYSLGIILFEMCYKPLETSMERIKIITKLRMKEITFPDDFLGKETERKRFLISWLLDHDVTKRPTSQELLQSELVPPPVLEECQLRELVRHTLNNPQLKGYKYLIASCFKQPVTSAQDITYDKDPFTSNAMKPLQLYDFVRQICVKIFKQHGGQNLSTPLLMPKSKYYEEQESCVNLMTHCGNIVSLPHDLRVPFARYVAWNGISLLRRYSIERVYREKKVFGFQPRELYECAFDIVSPTPGSLMSDAEVLYIVYKIINELPCVKNKRFLIKLNHTSLLKAILLHCGIKDKHQEVYDIISNVKESKVPKYQMQNYFITLGLSDNSINLLLNLLNSEFEISKAVNQFQMITKKKSNEASQLAAKALQELKIIGQNAEAYGVKFDIVVSPGLVYNVYQYSGMICQFVCDLKKKHKHVSMEVLAAGGRYDSMISSYRNIMEQANMLGREVQQSAVGISISLDRLVQALQKEEVDFRDIVVCSVGTSSKHFVRETTKILNSLWAAGIRCSLVEAANIEDLQEQLNDLKISIAIILKDSDQGTVRLRCWDKDRFQEKLLTTSELVENVQRILKSGNEGHQETVTSPSALARSESRTYSGERGDHCQEANVNVLFADKMSSNARKRCENQIRSQLDGLFKKLIGYVIVLGLTMEANVIRSLASFLEFDSEYNFQKSVECVIERHQKHKKYLSDVCDEIYEQKTKKTRPTIVLFSLSDSFYKVIL